MWKTSSELKRVAMVCQNGLRPLASISCLLSLRSRVVNSAGIERMQWRSLMALALDQRGFWASGMASDWCVSSAVVESASAEESATGADDGVCGKQASTGVVQSFFTQASMVQPAGRHVGSRSMIACHSSFFPGLAFGGWKPVSLGWHTSCPG